MIFNCPNCGKETVFLNNICEHCNCEVKKCPECGKISLINAETCNYCGYNLKSNINYKQEEKEEFKILTEVIPINEYAIKMVDIFGIIGIVSFLFFITLIGIAISKLTSFGNIFSLNIDEILIRLNNISDFKKETSIILVVGLFVCFASFIFIKGKNLFAWHFVSNKMQELKFNSADYYKIAVKRYETSNVDKKNYPLILGLITKFHTFDIRSKYFVKYFIDIFILLFSLGLIYLGLKENILLYIDDVAHRLLVDVTLASKYSFDFNMYLIAGLLLFFISIIYTPVRVRFNKKMIYMY